MKKHLLSLLFLALISLTGCEKETTLMNSLKGEWYRGDSYFKFTALKDFTYIDLHSTPWRGTVVVNGQTLINCDNRYSSYPTRRFSLNREIGFEAKWLYYKNKSYEINFPLGQIDNGEFKCDISIVHEGIPVNITVDLVASKIELKRGETFKLKDYRYSGDYLWIYILNFDSPKKISGDALLGDMANKLDGIWSINSGRMSLKYNMELSDDFIMREFNYIIDKKELLLFNPIAYSKYHIYGSIPEENITGLYYYNTFGRDLRVGN
jgi:hypothetical protein